MSKWKLSCWQCGKLYNASEITEKKLPVVCNCGGYVISPSGKMQLEKVE